MTEFLNSIRRLEPEACQRARMARDPRFDGEFFVAVTSTGIYCRPICPARLPAERNVRYFRLAAQAAQEGFRPCLRCRPEAAPGSPAWLGSASTVQRALRLIAEGALDDGGSVAQLAERLGVGSRYLLKLFRRELGVAPSELAANQRLLLARQLIVESALPLTEVAHAAGFSSLRRFNSAIREQFKLAPSDMRRRPRSLPGGGLRLALHYRAPYDWNGVCAFLARHAVSGVESVADGEYRRTLEGGGALRVRHAPEQRALIVHFELPRLQPLQPLVNRLRRMFDLDASPEAIAATLSADEVLAPLIRQTPGIRCPGYFSVGEATVRAIVGQQISTRAAQGICAGFVERSAGLFPSPAQLAGFPDDAFPMPTRRRDTLRSLARQYEELGEDACTDEALASLKGIGPWTTAMVALRGWGEPDAFPHTDLGLIQAWETLGGDRSTLAKRAQHWAPYRGYAANLLWRTL